MRYYNGNQLPILSLILTDEIPCVIVVKGRVEFEVIYHIFFLYVTLRQSDASLNFLRGIKRVSVAR